MPTQYVVIPSHHHHHHFVDGPAISPQVDVASCIASLLAAHGQLIALLSDQLQCGHFSLHSGPPQPP
eukprot:6594773-Karenia_brevis.AAC.1